MNRTLIIIIFLAVFSGFIGINAQSLQMLKQVKMSKWGIPAGDYSGICYLGNNHYAVVSDKQGNDGYYEFLIELDEVSGQVENVEILAFHTNRLKQRDAEDICYVKSTGKLYIAAEDDQRIIEYDTLGNLTGREMEVPEIFAKDRIVSNYGFESLTYSDKTALFWTCTESTLKADSKYATSLLSHEANIRLQAFDMNLKPLKAAGETYYITDEPAIKHTPRLYAFGVPALTALDDGSLLVLEREFYVAQNYLGSYVKNKIFHVGSQALGSFRNEKNDKGGVQGLVKSFLGGWTTHLNLTRHNIANYEGMCLGPKLKDGRQTILLISDSQGGYGNSLFHLKDYLRVGILEM